MAHIKYAMKILVHSESCNSPRPILEHFVTPKSNLVGFGYCFIPTPLFPLPQTTASLYSVPIYLPVLDTS